MTRTVWTLAQAARLLQEPQHRLIYICEKGVVLPDLADASGRGSSRRFSARNLLEFAIALRLRRLALPVTTIAAIIHTLRGFERRVASELPRFNLVDSLRSTRIDLRAIVGDGERLFFLLARKGQAPRLFGGVDLATAGSAKPPRLASRLEPQVSVPGGRRDRFGGPEGSRYVRVEIDLGQIARDLRLEE